VSGDRRDKPIVSGDRRDKPIVSGDRRDEPIVSGDRRDKAAVTQIVPVELADRSYEVLVGDGVRHELARVIAETVPGARRAVIVTQEGIGVEVDPGLPHEVFCIPDGESAKSLSVLESLCRDFARSGLNRADVVVAVGGGVVTDLAGFAAAAFHRGTAYVNVATSLLAQVDAAIGGKTGVNLPEGKNLVGAFWQPSAVLCDTGVLATLPPREWASGRGEVAKYALLGISTSFGGPPTADLPIEDQVARCAAIKSAVVSADEREGDRRMILNYGHTLAHALEASAFEVEGADLRHGEAVAVGLVYAALLAKRLGRIDDGQVDHHRKVVGAFDLATRLPSDIDPGELLGFMGRDKKAQGDLTFVLDGPEGVEVVHGVDRADVVATLTDMESTAPAGSA
jgi:5-deoxy-5-amino-3-dehydroquinate synthase